MLGRAIVNKTWTSYRSYITRFRDFCLDSSVSFPPVGSDAVPVIANFLENITRKSVRPAGQINGACAAIKLLYEVIDVNPFDSPLLKRLKKGLRKARTTRAIRHRGYVDPAKLVALFRSWGDSAEMPLDHLTIKLLALICMCGLVRTYTANNCDLSNARLTTDSASGKRVLTLELVGDKNDYRQLGNFRSIFECSDLTLCPVYAFSEYVRRTAKFRKPSNRKIFLSLQEPYPDLTGRQCAALLKKCSMLAGLDPAIFTGATYRVGGVMKALQKGIQPDAILRLGNWASPEVFWRHYVHREIPADFTDLLLTDLDCESVTQQVAEPADTEQRGRPPSNRSPSFKKLRRIAMRQLFGDDDDSS